jgi:hypothetical protein
MEEELRKDTLRYKETCDVREELEPKNSDEIGRWGWLSGSSGRASIYLASVSP